MTNVFELDGAKLHELAAAHAYLKEMLGFPAHYGNNADALFDCLTEIGGETILFISDADAVHPKLVQVFEDAMEQAQGLTVIFEESE